MFDAPLGAKISQARLLDQQISFTWNCEIRETKHLPVICKSLPSYGDARFSIPMLYATHNLYTFVDILYHENVLHSFCFSFLARSFILTML